MSVCAVLAIRFMGVTFGFRNPGDFGAVSGFAVASCPAPALCRAEKGAEQPTVSDGSAARLGSVGKISELLMRAAEPEVSRTRSVAA